MTVREQLTERVAAIRAVWALGGPKLATGWHRNGDIILEARLPVPPILMLLGVQFSVNAAEICGAEAGHLLLVYHLVSHQVPLEDSYGAACRVIVGMTYGERSWDSILMTVDPPTDFDALLDALDGVAESPPDRPETWRDRPPML
jgi:hypothetical protein